ncbi:hypothetical protein N8T08_009653 [Aspergillus melleus]|uniref:Uncharacterized protein n=1 Tax=Aspergillus melleus TaxID=138277 RepID=A0ACC3AT49_9EURO|nr:hypothetical protein N8T08_009653 [Aspergillus melleus]
MRIGRDQLAVGRGAAPGRAELGLSQRFSSGILHREGLGEPGGRPLAICLPRIKEAAFYF